MFKYLWNSYRNNKDVKNAALTRIWVDQKIFSDSDESLISMELESEDMYNEILHSQLTYLFEYLDSEQLSFWWVSLKIFNL